MVLVKYICQTLIVVSEINITDICLRMANKVDAKVVLLGKEYSGKTCLVERYLHGRFNKDIPYQNVSTLNAILKIQQVIDYELILFHCNKLLGGNKLLNH